MAKKSTEAIQVDKSTLLTEYTRIRGRRATSYVMVDQPLVFITQAPRSGGTLMMRLLDGHPQCHTIPHEIAQRLGKRSDLLGTTDSAWNALLDHKLEQQFDRGFKQARAALSKTFTRYPFILPPTLQREIFERVVDGYNHDPTERDIVNAYWTSYFNAWLDNQNLYGADKRWISGFSPRTITNRRAVERFNELYPEGRLISVIRDPKSWFVSARGWSAEFYRLDGAIDYWRQTAESMLAVRKRMGDRLFILTFEDLLSRTPDVMRSLAAWLDIEYTPSMTRPTFNSLDIKANSSFEVKDEQTSKVTTDPLERYREILTAEQQGLIDRLAGGLYERVAAERSPILDPAEAPERVGPEPVGAVSNGDGTTA